MRFDISCFFIQGAINQAKTTSKLEKHNSITRSVPYCTSTHDHFPVLNSKRNIDRTTAVVVASLSAMHRTFRRIAGRQRRTRECAYRYRSCSRQIRAGLDAAQVTLVLRCFTKKSREAINSQAGRQSIKSIIIIYYLLHSVPPDNLAIHAYFIWHYYFKCQM